MALIPIPADNPARWINPDHISHIVPRHATTPAGIELFAEVKILGIPEERIKLGIFDDLTAAQKGWEAFLAYLQAHSHDPARDSGTR